MIGVLATICKNIYLCTATLNRRNEIKAKEYGNDISVNYEDLISPEGREIAQVAAKSPDDDLFKALDNSNELDDGKGFD
ncbi:MAG: secreted protein with Ig-like and vWFA domain [Cognaticolwellia sp.]|jgi:secreted protein with Ig-like and vWFA domain